MHQTAILTIEWMVAARGNNRTGFLADEAEGKRKLLGDPQSMVIPLTVVRGQKPI